MDVASHIEGRVRVRSQMLKRGPRLSMVREALLSTPGVGRVEANPRVGSLLVLYSGTVTKIEKILKVVSDILENGDGAGSATELKKKLGGSPQAGRISMTRIPVAKRKIKRIGLLASMGLILGAATFDLKKLHLLAGITFLALLGDHLYQRRRQVFA
ncbi:MAG: hypothetical protein HY787_14625 [Deltaproteobacteria bacterium]|nr:hypothetical protein [Deltaproteobacteria bacterium]